MVIHCKYDSLVECNSLKPHPKNRNKHPEDQVDRLAKILNYQGLRAPIVVSTRSGKIVKGHGTLQAIKKNGWKEAPVVFQDFEDDDQEWLFLQSDNAIAMWSDLDLQGINLDLGELGPFDIDLVGIRNFTVDASEKINEINRGDENSEWVGMPEFKEGDNYIKLTYIFKSAEERDKFIANEQIKVDMKRNDNNWICYR
jgi:hypothetical protein